MDTSRQQTAQSNTTRLSLKSKASTYVPAAAPTTPTLKTEEAAQFLNVKPATLCQWRWRGVGPVFVKLSRSVRYRLSDLEDFMANQTFQSTTQAHAAKGV